LRASTEGETDPPFVPRVSLVRGEGMPPTSIASWERTIRALLPRTALVTVGDVDAGEMMMLAWSDVVALGGAYLTRVPDLYPPRWETKPVDDATFAAMRARRIDTPEKPAVEASRRPRRLRPPAAHPPRSETAKLAIVVALVIAASALAASLAWCG
jgi:hypothetical protein